MIDLHCHIDLYQNPKEVLSQVAQRDGFVLAVTTTPLAWNGTSSLIYNTPGVHIAAGLHPELVASRHQEVEQLCELLVLTRYVGEIGLDGSARHRDSAVLQTSVFRRVIAECEKEGGKILSIHSRGAASAVLEILRANVQRSVPVLHWFSGTSRELREARSVGCWFSVGPAMLKTKRGMSLVEAMPRNRVLTETDGPFATHGSGPLMPWHTSRALESLAAIWRCSREEAVEQLCDNLAVLVGSEDSHVSGWD